MANRIITRGLGPSQLLITRGYGGIETPKTSPKQGGIPSRLRITREINIELISKTFFEKIINTSLNSRTSLNRSKELDLRYNLMFEKNINLDIISRVLYNKNIEINLKSKNDKKDIINLLRAL